MRKKLLRLLRLVPIALAFAASVASAQTTGTIIGVVTDAATGKPVAGALVIATSANLQGEQTAVTDENGNYKLTLLPPGQYKLAVQLEGYKPADRSDILLRVDKTLRANVAVVPEAVTMEEQVVRTGMAPVINLGTAETGSVISKEFMTSIPVTRGFEGTAVATPSAQVDLYGISFSGATSPENNYIIDGMRVSDPTLGVLGTNILTNFVEQVDVKTGSFMPEYGHSSAGIVSVVTKSGSNEYHGSVWGAVQPGALTPSSLPTGRLGEAIASGPVPYKGGYDADFGFEVGGPIMKDKLWFYAGFAPVLTYQPNDRFLRQRLPGTVNPDGSISPQTDANGVIITQKLPGSDAYYANSATQYQVMGKLTYLLNENHNLTASFLTQPTSTQNKISDNGNQSARQINFDTNSTDLILRYAGRALDKRLLLEATAGWHRQTYKDAPKNIDGIDTATVPSISWRNSRRLTFFDNPPGFPNNNAAALGCNATGFNNCPVVNYYTGGYGLVSDTTDDRFAGRASLSYLFEAAGSHNLKAGIDADYTVAKELRTNSGSVSWRTSDSRNAIYQYRAYGTAPGLVEFVPGQLNVKTDTTQMGYFLQDSWTILNQVTLNFGVRWETEHMADPDAPPAATTSLTINDMFAPRVQAIWDFTGTGRGKVQGSWGRFYESIPLDMGFRSFGAEIQVQGGAHKLSTCQPGLQYGGNPLTMCPDIYGLAPGTNPIGAYSGTTPFSLYGNISPVDPNLKGMYVDMFGGAVEYEVLTDMSVGVEYQGRRLGNIIEDMSTDDGAHFFIANPATSKPWTSPDGVLNDPRRGLSLDPVTNMYFMAVFPEPIRRYDALILKLTKNLSNRWLAQASYTYSSFRGNYPGLFRAENGQLDPNITSEYDLASLLGNKYGPLASDKPHQVKLYGSYNYDIVPKVNVVGGVGFTAASGTPQGALGAHPLYGAGESYIIPRGMAGRLPWLYNMDLHGEVGYAISAPYTVKFTVDVYNILNQTTVQYIDQNWTFDTVQPMQAAQCSKKNSISKADPIAALQADCPDIRYLKTVDGHPATINGNYGRAQAGPPALYNIPAPAYQTPIRVRFGLTLAF